MECIILDLGSSISADLRSRSTARKLFSTYYCQKGLNKFAISFKNVVMMSRSFADEIYEFIDAVGKSNVEFTDVAENIELTLKIVEKNRNAKREFNTTGETKSFDNIKSLKKYLLESK